MASGKVDQTPLETGVQVSQLGHDNGFNRRVRQHFSSRLPDIRQQNQRFGAGIVQLVFNLTRAVQRVGVNHHKSGAKHRKQSNRILDNVGHLDRNAITGLEMGFLLQIGAERRRMALQIVVGQGMADAADRISRAIAFDAKVKQLDEILEFVWINGFGHSRPGTRGGNGFVHGLVLFGHGPSSIGIIYRGQPWHRLIRLV